MKFINTVKLIMLTAVLSVLAACNANGNGTTETSALPAQTIVSETHTTVTSTAVTTTTVTTTAVTTADTSSEAAATETLATTTELPFEDTPQNAYARLSASFLQEDGNEKAPEDYAGAYAYGGTLFVCTTSAAPGEYYTSLLSDYTCVSYKKMKHSLNELTAICERAKEILDPVYGVGEVYVDVPSNKAAITVTSGDYASARTLLINTPDLGFTVDMIEVSVEEPEEE